MESLQIINRNGELYTDSRDVAKMTGKRHDHLLRDIDGYTKILAEATNPNFGGSESKNGLSGQSTFAQSDFFIPATYTDSTGRTLPRYDCTRKGCDMIANKLTGKKGVLFTAAYVSAFEQMQQYIAAQNAYKLPQNMAEALRLAADLSEHNEALQAKIEADEGKVQFAEDVEHSSTCISVGAMANLLHQAGFNIGRTRFFIWLRDNHYLHKGGRDYNKPKQHALDAGWFEIKTTTRIQGGEIVQDFTPLVTGKGQLYFINGFRKMEENGTLPAEFSRRVMAGRAQA